MNAFGKMSELVKKALRWIKDKVTPRPLAYAGRDTWRCPMCLEVTEGMAEDYILFCSECLREEMNAAAREERPPKPYEVARPKSLANPVCRHHDTGFEGDVRIAPFLSHRGCKCRNPLWQGQTIAPLFMGDSLEFQDRATGQTISVSHWSLPRMVEAAKEVGPGLDALGMWFPGAMVAAMEPNYQRSQRVMLWGPRSVGKTVLSSCATALPTFARDGSVVGVVNHVYASPWADVDRKGRFPWQVYAEALRSLVDLGEFVYSGIRSTDPSDVVRGDRRTVYTAFFKGLTDDGKDRTLLMYDMAGEDLKNGAVAGEIRHLDATTDVTYLMIDVGDLAAIAAVIGTGTQPTDAKRKNSVKTALDALRDNSQKPMIVVISKTDLVPDFDAAATVIEALKALQQLKDEIRAVGRKPLDPQGLGERSLEVLKSLLADSPTGWEKELFRHLNHGRVEAAFFIWTEGLIQGSEPTSFGVAQLIQYTLTRSEPNMGNRQRSTNV